MQLWLYNFCEAYFCASFCQYCPPHTSHIYRLGLHHSAKSRMLKFYMWASECYETGEGNMEIQRNGISLISSPLVSSFENHKPKEVLNEI
jgi:hypothetical protein